MHKFLFLFFLIVVATHRNGNAGWHGCRPLAALLTVKHRLTTEDHSGAAVERHRVTDRVIEFDLFFYFY